MKATFTETPSSVADMFEPGTLVILKGEGKTIVLVTDTIRERERFSGVVVSRNTIDPSGPAPGLDFSGWITERFRPFRGAVTLTQD